MLQYVLPEEFRANIISFLFEKYVGIPEVDFSSRLYMTVDEVKALVASGMYVGSHGSTHKWLNSLNTEKQKDEIVGSLEFLEEIGASTSNWVMCYPYGAYNDVTLSLLKAFGASVGVTIEARKANLGSDNPLTLPRLDANDFPQ